MSQQHSPASPDGSSVLSFSPVAVRPRHDGWTAQKQVRFIQALAATGCVEEAARHVGMSSRSARDLRTRRDAASLRAAWDAALATGVGRLEEAAMARAIHGVAVPIFYKGEQVGERRRFDERLTALILRYRASHRYGAWRDRVIVRQQPDAPALILEAALARLAADCAADATGTPRRPYVPTPTESFEDEPGAARQPTADERRQQQEGFEGRMEELLRKLERDEAARADQGADQGAEQGGSSEPCGSSATGEWVGTSDHPGTSGSPHEGGTCFSSEHGGSFGSSAGSPSIPGQDA